MYILSSVIEIGSDNNNIEPKQWGANMTMYRNHHLACIPQHLSLRTKKHDLI